MAEEPKKISFGFTKTNKKTFISAPKNEDKNIQFIDCLEGKSIKLVNGEEKEKGLPIIPLRNGNILRDNMIETLKARKVNKPTNESSKQEIVEDGKHIIEDKPLTLDELAAKEILEDLNKVKESDEIQETLTIPQVETIQVSEKESTLEDYESMPVNQFGLAVLRGMGWTPDKGIGKNAQIVKPVNPVVRPKGMGLGADKVISVPKIGSKDELLMKKGASLKVTSGPHKGIYGLVEGFDELPGRIIVRLSLQNNVISISENLVELVTLSEYNKNSKVLNIKEYNNFVNTEKLPVKEMEVKSEKNKSTGSSDKIKEEYSSEEGRKHIKEERNNYKHKDQRNDKYRKSDDKYKKFKNKKNYSDDSLTDSESRLKQSKHKSSRSRHRSSSHRNESREVVTSDSDSDSSVEKKKTKSRKHHKSKSRHRSRSRSTTRRKKKRNRHRSKS